MEKEKIRNMDYSIDFFNNLIPELNEKLNLIEKELNKPEFQNNNFKDKNEQEINNSIKKYINDELIKLCKNEEKKDSEKKGYFDIINETFSFNFFTIVIINPEGVDFNHHCSPAIFGNIKTDGIYTKNFDFEYDKKEIYVAVTIFGFNNHF
jgi:hypothetical protein